jgi:hypothetical protein
MTVLMMYTVEPGEGSRQEAEAAMCTVCKFAYTHTFHEKTGQFGYGRVMGTEMYCLFF